MKIRSRLFSCRTSPRRRFALHPLSFAVCLAMSSAALALPQGGTVVNGNATITKPTSTTELIKQTTDKAIIDWKSFSIAAGEQVRFSQPSTTSITLNRVTGYDPSYILGQMSSNGKIFLVNPYGVVFGAGARVDVGGLVVSSLSIADNDFLAGRYNLTSVDPKAPTQRGEVRNDGLISAPGGIVVLAGPSVTNTGTIVANGGRVGLAAANSVSVDVEGDGLIFFQANATEAQNRLAQLGRIQADGGTVEMRAAARGAFADTVLNMAGVVQARGIGTREGRIVIDGGTEGITSVSGQIDASGAAAGQHGGDVAVLGQRILLDNGARIDASGDAGGGAIRIGGGFHGADPALHNAEAVVVEPDAQLRADAVTTGNGGTVAVWSDGATKYQGRISATGGANGGDGGYVEVSGHQSLAYDGNVDTRAPHGAIGTLLLDPTDITIDAVGQSGTLNNAGGVFTDPNSPSTIKASTLTGQLASTDVVVSTASAAAGAGTITVTAPISWSNSTSLTLKATTDITVNTSSAITNGGTGDLNLFASGNITLNSPVSLAGGNFKVAGTAGGASVAASFTSGAAGTITTSGPAGVTANGTAGGNVMIATSGSITAGNIAARGGDGPADFSAGNGGIVSLNSSNGAISTGSIDTSGGAETSLTGLGTGAGGGDVMLTIGAGGTHTLTTGVITAAGGKGPDDLAANGQGGTGGAGGTVAISNGSNGTSTLQSIDTSGGAAGAAGSGASDGGHGGAAGTITLTSNGGTLSVANLTALGGDAGAPNLGGNPGAAGASQAIAMNFGQTSPGTLDLSNATTIAGLSATATGGAGTDTVIVVGGAGETIALAPALLSRSVAGDVTLASIETADVTAGGGTTNLAGWTGGRTATVQLTSGAGLITGNGNGTTLRGLDAGSAFTVNAANGGAVDATPFSAVGNLAGGAGADSFTVTNAGTLSGNIDGGAGANSLDLSAKLGAITINQTGATTGSGVAGTIAGIGSYVGNGATTTFIGSNAVQTYTVTAADTVSVAGIALSGVGNLAGGSAADTFVVQAGGSLSGSIDGGGGANTLDLSARGTADFGLTSAAAGTASGVSGGYSNVGILIGNATTSTLTGSNVASTFNVTAINAGTVNDGTGTTTFSGMPKLVGGSAADSFVIGAGVAIAGIDGGGGADSLSVTAGSTENIGLTDLQLTRSVAGTTTLANVTSATLVGGSGANTIDGHLWSGALALQLSGGADVLTGNGANSTLVAAAGGSTITATGADAGNVGATTFTQIGNLMGAAGVDVFAITGGATLSGAVTGVGGNDTLDLSAKTGTVTINQSGAIAGSGIAGAITGISSYIGNGASTTFVGSNAAQTYTIAAPNTVSVGGVSVSGVGNVTGGTAADTFVLQNGGTLSGTIDGGSGAANTLDLGAKTGAADFALASASSGTASGVTGGYSNISTLVGKGTTSTLTGTGTGSTFTVNASDAGTVNDGAGTTNFSGVGKLVGGSGNDGFAIANAGSLSGTIDGGSGTNTLDLSGKAGAANVGLTSASTGTASGVTGGYSNVTALVGNGSTSALTGTNAASTYTVSGADSGNVGTTTFSGMASLVGGSAADTFVLQAGGTLSGSIDGGAGANTLDLSGRGAANFTLTSPTAGGASGVTGGYGNVATLIGNGSTSTLTGTNAASSFIVNGADAGTVNGATSFSGIANLAGGSAADTFVLQAGGVLSGSLDGGAGVNTLDSSALGTANFGLTSASSGTASGIGTGYSGVAVLVGNGASTLTGTNAASTFAITGNNAGTVNDGSGTATFSGVAKLVGGAGADSFVIGTGFAIGSIDGGAGANSLSATAGASESITLANALLTRSATVAPTTILANITSATLVGGSANNAIDASGWTGGRTATIQLTAGTDSITGNGAGTTLVAAAGGSTINVTGADAGNAGTTNFSQVGNLMGAAGADTFAITNAGTLSGGITGVGGNDTLDLHLKAGIVTISQSGATTGSGVSGPITGIANFVGNGANTTFIGNNAAQTYTVTAADTVTVSGMVLNGIGSLRGGSAADAFVVQAAGSLSGNIDGGGGANTLDLSARAAAGTANFGLASASSGTASAVAGGYSNVATLIGNGVNSTVTASSTASTFAINAGNAGTINDGVGTTTFSGVANLVGGAASDTFAVANAGSLTGNIDGGAGANMLDLSARGTANFALTSTSAGTASGVAGGYSNVNALVGNGTSTLTGSNGASSYGVTGANAGTVNGSTSFSGVASLVGGSAADTFTLGSAGTLSGGIDGGAGANTLDLSGRGAANFALTSASAGSASGLTGGYANITTLVGNGSSSTLTGTNAVSTYSVTGANSGTLNAATNFSGIANLAAGSSADAFVVQAAGSLSGSIDGGAGANTLDLSARATANFGLTNASSGNASGIGGGYSNTAVLIGNGTSSTLTGTNSASTFSVTGNNAGTVNDGSGTTTFSGMPKLVGGSAADGFIIGTGFAIGSIDGGSGAANSLSTTAAASENITLGDAQLSRSVAGNTALANIASASLTGGSGNNVINAAGWTGTVAIQATAGSDSITGNGVGTTVIGTAAPSTFNLTGPDSGALSDGINVTTLVSGVGNLTGGAGNDIFLIQNAGTLSGNLNGGGGLNTLDLSNKSSATIVFNTSSSSVSGVGIVGTLSNIGALIGNVTNTSLQGNATGQAFAITANNEITVDGNQVFKGVANLDAGVGPDSISGTTFKLAGHIDDAGGVTTLSGTIRTDGSQTYAGAVVAPAVTLVALGGISAVNPANDFGTVSLTGGAIDVHDANAINLASIAVGAGQPLAITATGTITLNGNVTSTADQTYNGNVALAANAVLDAGAGQIAVRGTLDGGAHDLTLASAATGPGAITLGGSVGNVGTFSANGNATLTGDVASTGAQTFAGTLALTGNTTLDAGASKLDLRGAVDGGGNSLVARSTNAAPDAIHVGGAIGDMAQFDANGRSTLAADVTTTGNQTYAGTVTLAADLTLDAGVGTVALQNGLDGSGAMHSVTLASTAAGSNAITTGAPVANVGIFDVNGNATLAGNVSSTGTQTFAGTLTLTGNTTLDAGAGKVDLHGTVDGGGNSLTASSTNAAADAIRIGGAIGNTAQFNANGRSTLDANVTTTGAQTYAGAVTLAVDTTLTGNAVSFGSTIDGAFDLDVRAGATSFVGAVGATAALASLTTDAAGSTQIGSSVRTTGAQTYNDNVVLTGDSAMTGSALVFNGQVDGAHALSLTSASPVTFAQSIGAVSPLAALSVAGPVALDGPSVTTTGAQVYGGAVVLGASTTLTGSTLGFASTIDGAVALTLNGASSFAGAVGAGTTLTSLTTNGAVQIAGNGVLRSDAIDLNGAVSGATDLTLQTNALSGGNSIAGTGTFSIVPIDSSLSIGVAGGAGSLQVAQSVLTGATGFTSHVIGDANGSGAIAVGNLTLGADTTLQTATGDINLTGSVDGAHALTLNSGGTTRIAGPIGVTTPLTSLTTDNNATSTDWNGTSGERTTFDTADGSGAARIVTTGAQTYNDPLTTSVPISFTGGAITATQATNSLAGTVSAVADSLQLKSTGDLTLGGTITLANGGAIEAGNVLHLNGALQLNGGTLVLTSDAALSAASTFGDPTLPVNPHFGGVTLNEASPAIVQDGGTIKSAAGSLLVLRAPNGGSILLDQLDSSNLPVNQLLGSISAVSGQLGDDGSRFNGTAPIDLGFIRIASSEIHVAGKPSGTDQTTLQAGLEGDVIKLTADVLTTGADGLIRARLPFNSLQGSTSSIPALTFVLTPTALTNATPPNATSYGNPSPDSFIQIQVGSAAAGGFITTRVVGTPGSGAGKVVFLGGGAQARPFYDGNGKLTEIRIFYNGDAPRTPQEAGALAAVIAIIEEARHARFEEAVRTENVSSRLRSGVIAEVGAGRPATVGRESIRLPETCDVKPGTLRCE